MFKWACFIAPWWDCPVVIGIYFFSKAGQRHIFDLVAAEWQCVKLVGHYGRWWSRGSCIMWFLFYGGCGNTLIAPNSSPPFFGNGGLNALAFSQTHWSFVQAGVAAGRFKDIPRLNHLEEFASGGLITADSQMKVVHMQELAWKYVLKTLEKILRPCKHNLWFVNYLEMTYLNVRLVGIVVVH